MVVQDTRVTVLVPKALQKRVVAHAKKTNVSIGQLVRDALTEYLGTPEHSHGQ